MLITDSSYFCARGLAKYRLIKLQKVQNALKIFIKQRFGHNTLVSIVPSSFFRAMEEFFRNCSLPAQQFSFFYQPLVVQCPGLPGYLYCSIKQRASHTSRRYCSLQPANHFISQFFKGQNILVIACRSPAHHFQMRPHCFFTYRAGKIFNNSFPPLRGLFMSS